MEQGQCATGGINCASYCHQTVKTVAESQNFGW